MAGSEQFAELLSRHQSLVYSIAYNFLHDQAAAEDLAQDVFLELHRNLDRLTGEQHVVYWLRKVTSRRCIDYSRRRKFRKAETLDEVEEPGVSPILSDPFLSERVTRGIAALPETPRLVLVLRYQEEMEPYEIAEMLAMPVNTVKSHLQRALAALRQKLERVKGKVHS